MKRTWTPILIFLAAPAFAELDAHEHGVGELNIAIDGTTVAMELHAPGADIVGFEYEAKSAEDRAAIDTGIAILSKPLDLFVVPAAAECNVVQALAKLESEDAHDDHGHDEHAHDDHGHDEHGHDKHEDHAHGDEAHDDHHDEHEDHAHGHDDHDDHADEARHTEFHAEYTLNCGNTSALTEITFAYFDTFPNALELEVQVVSAAGAQAFEVERDDPSLDLRGMF